MNVNAGDSLIRWEKPQKRLSFARIGAAAAHRHSLIDARRRREYIGGMCFAGVGAMFSKVVIFTVAVILAAPICAATGGGGSGGGSSAGASASGHSGGGSGASSGGG